MNVMSVWVKPYKRSKHISGVSEGIHKGSSLHIDWLA